MESPLISIVIPVYNVENYLERCVRSVIDQAYRNLEIILVDDGSTDASSRMCDAFGAEDRRIVVIHQKNRGLSGARNAGLDKANGEYVAFLDGDDFVDPEMYGYLLTAIRESGGDVAQTGYKRVRANGELRKQCSFRVAEYTSFKEMVVAYFDERNIHVSTWSKLYKRSIFTEIRFIEGKVIEDFEILLKVMHNCRKFIVTETAYYNYVQSGNSISRKPINRLMAQSRLDIPIIAYETMKEIDPALLGYIVAYICESAIVGYCGVALTDSIPRDERMLFKRKFITQYREYYQEFRKYQALNNPSFRYVVFNVLPFLILLSESIRRWRLDASRALRGRIL